MHTTTTAKTIARWVIEFPVLARVFERHGIDYCCGGKRALAEVCHEKGLTVEQLLRELEGGELTAGRHSLDCSRMTMTELADHIVATHHDWLSTELPRLANMVKRVEDVHAEHHPEIHELRHVLASLQDEMEAHMWKEEHVLFPMIKTLDAADLMPKLHCGSIVQPIQVMEYDHQNVGDAIEKMRMLTNDYTPPPEACSTYHLMLEGLAELEADTHRHVHKENNILFPAAARKEVWLVRDVRKAVDPQEVAEV